MTQYICIASLVISLSALGISAYPVWRKMTSMSRYRRARQEYHRTHPDEPVKRIDWATDSVTPLTGPIDRVADHLRTQLLSFRAQYTRQRKHLDAVCARIHEHRGQKAH